MSWNKLLSEGRVAAEPSSKQELDNLRSIVQLRLSDLKAKGLSHEQQFIIAYDAVRTLSMMIVRASGYRPKKIGGHYNTFMGLEAADGAFADQAGYFDTCRLKRNESEYDFAGSITETETEELIEAAIDFQKAAEAWLTKHFPQFV